MNLSEIQKKCHEITVSKGFDLSQLVKQSLLIGSEVSEALEVIDYSEAPESLKSFVDAYMCNMKFLEDVRKDTSMAIHNDFIKLKELTKIMIDNLMSLK